ncbi:MAG: hypothetical protein ACRYG4_08390 [Janthinobacterium lividum]
MRWSVPLLVFALAACAGSGGTWPSLARRTGEGAPMVARPAPGSNAGSSVAAPPVAAAPVAVLPVSIADVPARLSTIERDLTDLASRLQQQSATTGTAIAAARGAKTDSDAWSAAQLQLTRLEQSGNQVGDIRDRLDRVAGTLAAAAAGGADVVGPLRRVGLLLDQVEKMDEGFKSGFAASNAAIRP